MDCSIAEEEHLLAQMLSASRAGSPLLFGLAPRGVFRASGVATEAVGSYPTFSPLPNGMSICGVGPKPCPALGRAKVRPHIGVAQVFLSDATVLHSAGGLSFCGTIRELQHRLTSVPQLP